MDERSEIASGTESEGPNCAIDKSCCGGTAEATLIEDGCTLNPSEMPERRARWQTLFAQALGHDVGEGEALFRFQRTPALEAELSELVKLERVCCAHVGWDLKSDRDEVLLTLKADAGALGVLVKRLMSGEFGDTA